MKLNSKKYNLTTFFLVFWCVGSVLAGSEMPNPSSWFPGKTAEAFAVAKKKNKNIFVYWGAEWCPPCNKLKSDVLSHPGFPALTKDTINIYMDGEAEGIQLWSEKLNVTGYPTLLFLTPEGKEIMRLQTALDFAGFSENFKYAQSQHEDGVLLLRRLLGYKKIDSEAASLTLRAFRNHKDLEAITKNHRVKLRKLLHRLKKKKMHAGLASEWYLYNLGLGKTGKKLPKVDVSWAQRYFLDVVFKEENLSTFSSFITRDASGVAKMFHRRLSSKDFTVFGRAWELAAKKIRTIKDPVQSVRVLASSEYPYITLHDLDPEQFPLGAARKTQIGSRSIELISKMDDGYKRKSALSVVAYVLSRVGKYSEAKKVLQKEAETSSSSWYFLDVLSYLAKSNQENADALSFSKMALDAADTPAAKIQMYKNYFGSLSSLGGKSKNKLLAAATVDFYGFSAGVSGAFVGRNVRASNWLLQNRKSDFFTGSLLAEFAKISKSLCAKQEGASLEACQEHVRAMSKG